MGEVKEGPWKNVLHLPEWAAKLKTLVSGTSLRLSLMETEVKALRREVELLKEEVIELQGKVEGLGGRWNYTVPDDF